MIIKLIGVATVVGMVVRWKRMRLPLLLLLLLLLLQRIACSREASIERGMFGSMPAGDIEHAIPLNTEFGESPDAGPLDPINPGCPDPTTCGDPLLVDGGPRS